MNLDAGAKNVGDRRRRKKTGANDVNGRPVKTKTPGSGSASSRGRGGRSRTAAARSDGGDPSSHDHSGMDPMHSPYTLPTEERRCPPGFGPPTPSFATSPQREARTVDSGRPQRSASKTDRRVYNIQWLWSVKDETEYATPLLELPAELSKNSYPSSRARNMTALDLKRRGKGSRGDEENETPEWFSRDEDNFGDYSFKVLDNDDKAHWAQTGQLKKEANVVLSLRDYEKKEKRKPATQDMFENLNADQPFNSNDILEALRKDREAVVRPPNSRSDAVGRETDNNGQGKGYASLMDYRTGRGTSAARMMKYGADSADVGSSRRFAGDRRRISSGTDPSTLAYASRTATQLMKQQIALLGYSFVPNAQMLLRKGGLTPEERERLTWEDEQRKKYLQAIQEASMIQDQRNAAAYRKLKKQQAAQAQLHGDIY